MKLNHEQRRTILEYRGGGMSYLPETSKQMSMRHQGGIMSLRKEHQRIENDFNQAAGFLRHDLVWSEDFESIRAPLATFLEEQASHGASNPRSLLWLVKELLSGENDMTI